MEESVKANNFYYGWVVVIITFITLLVSAGIRSMPSILILPFETEYSWSRGGISSVISFGIFLYGLVGPFSASLLQRFGIRRVILITLAILATSLSFTPFMTSIWQFHLLWGFVSGLATGMMANVLGVTISNNWFSKRQGTVVGLLTASAATGQLLFLPLLSMIIEEFGWRYSIYSAIGAIIFVFILVAIWMRNHPYDIGVAPYGSKELVKPPVLKGNSFLAPLHALRFAMKNKTFWILSGTFFFCGFSTNGLIGTHLVAAGHDHGIPTVTAAGLLAFMGVFDLIGTTLSGYLSDRYDSRKLLFWYYGLRGISLLFLPIALGGNHLMLLIFSVFYGLDWIATVPPTVKLASQEFGKEKAGMIFGWIVVAHQIGASTAAYSAGIIRDILGSYTVPFIAAGIVCLLAALMAMRISKVSKESI